MTIEVIYVSGSCHDSFQVVSALTFLDSISLTGVLIDSLSFISFSVSRFTPKTRTG